MKKSLLSNLEIPAALTIQAENSLLSFTVKQQMPGESGDVGSTGGGGHRYLGVIVSPTAGSKSRELGTLLLLDSNLFPILSSPTGF